VFVLERVRACLEWMLTGVTAAAAAGDSGVLRCNEGSGYSRCCSRCAYTQQHLFMQKEKRGCVGRIKGLFTHAAPKRVHPYPHVHAHTQTCTHAHTHTGKHARTRVHLCTHARMQAHAHARMHACTHARTHARTRTYTHARTYVRTYTLIRMTYDNRLQHGQDKSALSNA